MKAGRVLLLLTVAAALAFFVFRPELAQFQRLNESIGKLVQTSGEGQEERLIEQAGTHFQNRDSVFLLTYKGNHDEATKQLPKLLERARFVDDYTAYILGGYSYAIRSRLGRSQIEIKATYRETKNETAEVDKQVKQAIDQIIDSKMNDHERVKAVNDWLVERIDYDYSLTYYSAYDALVHNVGVCQSYSLLTYKLLEAAGVTNRIIEGRAGNEEHSWNLVLLDGAWYHLDVTWNDGYSGRLNAYPYYLKTDLEMQTDHSWTLDYPLANTFYLDALHQLEQGEDGERFTQLKRATGYHWYEDEELIADVPALQRILQEAIKERKEVLQFVYVHKDGFQEVLQKALDNIRRAVTTTGKLEPFGLEGNVLVTLELSYQ